MEIVVQRKPADGDCLPGECFIDHVRYSFTLERTSKAIPAGRYPLRFTPSARAERGELWSPDPEDRLPLVDDVPGRVGIRVHAANDPDELLGCIAVGLTFAHRRLGSSRAALGPFVAKVRDAAARHEEIWLEVRNPIAPDGETRAA
jgi:hypothetical protein